MLNAEWQNPGQPYDINDDLFVTPADALVGINRLNQIGPGPLEARPPESLLPFYDSNGDEFHSPNDVLVVINAINSLKPLIAARLLHDTAPNGTFNRDWISSDPSLIANVSPANAVTLRAGFDDMLPSEYVDVTNSFVNGRFVLTEAILESILSEPLMDGHYDLQLVATDAAGAESDVTTFAFSIDRTAPMLDVMLNDIERQTFRSFSVEISESVDESVLDPLSYSLVVEGGTNHGERVPISHVTMTGSDKELLINFSTELADETFRFTSTAPFFDAAGNVANAIDVTFSVVDPVDIAVISPADGEEMVSVTRETIVRFDERIDPSTVTADSFYLIANGEVLSGRVVVSSTERFATFFYDEPLPASTEIRVVVNGNEIVGQDGLLLDGDGDGRPGGRRQVIFRTLPLTRIAGTNVFGFVRDSYTGEPIVGATIRVDAFPETNFITDENGRFELVDMPAPEFFVHIDGSTSVSAPDGFTYPNVGKPFHSVPGQIVQLNMNGEPFDVFLPPMALSDLQQLSSEEATTVGFGDAGKAELELMFPEIDPALWNTMTVTIAPDGAIDDNGNAATQAAVIPVPPDRIPAPLPANLDPKLVISIQAVGANNFDVPVPVVFPKAA